MTNNFKALLVVPFLLGSGAAMCQAAEPIQNPAGVVQAVRPATGSPLAQNSALQVQDAAQAFTARSPLTAEPQITVQSSYSVSSPNGQQTVTIQTRTTPCTGPVRGQGCGVTVVAIKDGSEFTIGGGTKEVRIVAVDNAGNLFISGESRSNPYLSYYAASDRKEVRISGIAFLGNPVTQIVANATGSGAIVQTKNQYTNRIQTYNINPNDSTYSQVSVNVNPANHPNVLRTTTTETWGFDGLKQTTVVFTEGKDLITTSRLVILYVRGVKTVAFIETFKRGKLVSKTFV